MKFVDIRKSANALLKSKYPKYEIYGKEVSEGYKKPSFFVEILDTGTRQASKSFVSGGFTIIITYFQKKIDEMDQLTKVDEIRELFMPVLRVGDRHLLISDYSYDYTGEHSEILQISMDYEYKENIYQPETQEPADELYMNLRKE